IAVCRHLDRGAADRDLAVRLLREVGEAALLGARESRDVDLVAAGAARPEPRHGDAARVSALGRLRIRPQPGAAQVARRVLQVPQAGADVPERVLAHARDALLQLEAVLRPALERQELLDYRIGVDAGGQPGEAES